MNILNVIRLTSAQFKTVLREAVAPYHAQSLIVKIKIFALSHVQLALVRAEIVHKAIVKSAHHTLYVSQVRFVPKQTVRAVDVEPTSAHLLPTAIIREPVFLNA